MGDPGDLEVLGQQLEELSAEMQELTKQVGRLSTAVEEFVEEEEVLEGGNGEMPMTKQYETEYTSE